MEAKTGKNIVAILRTAVLVAAILLEVALFVAITIWFGEFGIAFTIAMDAASVLVVLRLVSKNDDPSYRIAWLIIVLVMPGFGLLLYLAWGRGAVGFRTRRMLDGAFGKAAKAVPDDAEALAAMDREYPSRSRIARQMSGYGFPMFRGADTRYYPLGEQFYDALCEDMERAERFILLEFFIVEYGAVWSRILEILRRKAARGVRVRLLYDDAGCLFTLKSDFAAKLRNAGIETIAFGSVHKYISELHVNYRNHQKIAVIDGDIGYAGGNNIADEYANIFPKLGHWKDTAVRIEGEAVISLTSTFLSMWDLAHRMAKKAADDDYGAFRPTRAVAGASFVQPVSDGPANNPENPIEDLYIQTINAARRYCYITTPYLVIDARMSDALRLAARSGVDVRIYTPGIPDHWYVHPVTRSYYGRLLEEGVRIMEYSPGFMHAKMVVSDDEAAIVGSVNMDFRSFYLHYENTVLFVGDPVVDAVRDDILALHGQCAEITYAMWKARPLSEKALGYALRIFATLM